VSKLNTVSEKHTFWRKYKWVVFCIAAGLIAWVAMTAVFIPKVFHHLNPELAEHLGAFVGGYFGPLFALSGVFLLVFTLQSQRLASSEATFEDEVSHSNQVASR
jgi:hypothetical protein